MALVHTIPETDATIPPPVRESGNGTLPTDWLRSFDGTTRTDYKLFAPIAYAMQALHIAALADGVRFATTGRFRSYARQEALFLERYTPGPFDPAVHRSSPSIVRRVWNGREWYLKRGMAMAATPGTSNHGWGIADDVCELDANGRIISITATGLQWLKDNAHRFGFALDLHEEPWHWHWHRPGHVCELTQETVDVLHAAGVSVPDLSTFGFAAPAPTPPPPPPTPPIQSEEDPMFIARDSTTGKMWLGNLISKVECDDATAQARIAFAQRAGRPILNTDGQPVLWEHKLSTVLSVSDQQIRALGGAPQ